MEFKIRPFEKHLEHTEETTAVKVCGSIADEVFLFSVEGGCWPLPMVECGVDGGGAYAILRSCQIELTDGFTIAVEEDENASDDEGYPAFGFRICLVKPGNSQVQETIVREQGLDRREATVRIPSETLIAVSVGPSGNVNDYVCTGLVVGLNGVLPAQQYKR